MAMTRVTPDRVHLACGEAPSDAPGHNTIKFKAEKSSSSADLIGRDSMMLAHFGNFLASPFANGKGAQTIRGIYCSRR
jgi:hypothetical protein